MKIREICNQHTLLKTTLNKACILHPHLDFRVGDQADQVAQAQCGKKTDQNGGDEPPSRNFFLKPFVHSPTKMKVWSTRKAIGTLC
jgi:hypothetical protein